MTTCCPPCVALPVAETPSERKRRLARERQRRKRGRDSIGDRPALIPGDIADEIDADDRAIFSARIAEILRRSLVRDGA